MTDQTSFRLPPAMLRELQRVAIQRGVPKSQLVREALERYLANPAGDAPGLPLSARSAPFIGSINLSGPGEAEGIADRVRRRNWRE
jgi:hypothetical protein